MEITGRIKGESNKGWGCSRLPQNRDILYNYLWYKVNIITIRYKIILHKVAIKKDVYVFSYSHKNTSLKIEQILLARLRYSRSVPNVNVFANMFQGRH